jgi:hypothetical protein
MNQRVVLACFFPFLLFFSCTTPRIMQPSVSIEAFKMDEETKSIFRDTNPDKASFSIVLGPIDREVCMAYAKFYGFKGRKNYLLFCLNTGDPDAPIAMHSITIEDAFIIEGHGKNEIKKNCFAFQVPAYPGFQSNWYLWSEDDAVRICQSITAKPLQAIGVDGATLKVVRKESGGNIVEIQASGLKEGEQVCFVFRSLGEEFFYPVKAPEKGKLHLPLVSSSVGIQRRVMSGTATVLLVRESETLDLSYEWDLSTTTVAAKKF